VIAKPSDVEIIHVFRVRCPQCGDLPSSPYASMRDARTARRAHFNDHRDERI
jgi:sarcosine oxidase delta subunit